VSTAPVIMLKSTPKHRNKLTFYLTIVQTTNVNVLNNLVSW